MRRASSKVAPNSVSDAAHLPDVRAMTADILLREFATTVANLVQVLVGVSALAIGTETGRPISRGEQWSRPF